MLVLRIIILNMLNFSKLGVVCEIKNLFFHGHKVVKENDFWTVQVDKFNTIFFGVRGVFENPHSDIGLFLFFSFIKL